jgi:hypothetical protein
VFAIAGGGDYVVEGNATAIGTITDNEPGDFGDAPGPYPTTLAADGARHVATGPTLGSKRDSEADGQPIVGAIGDDSAGTSDEDGVHFGLLRVGLAGASAVVHVRNAPAGAYLDAWIDFNGDGNWDGPTERIAARELMYEGDNTITFDLPSSSRAGTTYARFRLSSTGGLGPIGAAIDGEVEDYAVVINAPRSTLATFAAKQIVVAGETVDRVAAADLDGDGDTDLVGISEPSHRLAWYENDGQGGFARHIIDAAAEGTALVVADIEGDGDIDVLAFGRYELTQYSNDGHGSFVASRLDYLDENGAAYFVPADLDGDGDVDLLAGAGEGSSYNLMVATTFRGLRDQN